MELGRAELQNSNAQSPCPSCVTSWHCTGKEISPTREHLAPGPSPLPILPTSALLELQGSHSMWASSLYIQPRQFSSDPHIWSPFKLLEKAPDCLCKIPDSPQETVYKWRGQALVLMDSPLKTCLQGKQRKAHWRLFAISVSTHMLEMHHLPSDLLNWNPGGGYQHCLVFCLLVCLFGLLSFLVFTLFFKLFFSIENTGFPHGVFIRVSSYFAINRVPSPLPSLYHPSSWIPFCLHLSLLPSFNMWCSNTPLPLTSLLPPSWFLFYFCELQTHMDVHTHMHFLLCIFVDLFVCLSLWGWLVLLYIMVFSGIYFPAKLIISFIFMGVYNSIVYMHQIFFIQWAHWWTFSLVPFSGYCG